MLRKIRRWVIIISFDSLDLDNFIFQIQIKESLGNTSEEIISKIDENESNIRREKSVSVVFHSDFDSDNDEWWISTEFEEKAESDNLEDNSLIKDTLHYEVLKM
jgi:hypothetical protein